MRYELADCEWDAIKPMLPNKPRGIPRVNDRRVLNGIFWVLRSGAPWRDLPEAFDPYTTCYNRFVRWRRAGVWSRIIDALAAAHDAAVQMIDTSIVRVHQHAAWITAKRRDRADIVAARQREAQALAGRQIEKAKMDAQRRRAEADVGPVRYLAELMGMAATDLERPVRLLTLALVAVLDPMAVVLLLAAGIHTTRAGSR